MNPTEVISLVTSILARQPKVRRVVLFGSRARGDNFPRSDVDLAVSLPGGTATEWQELVDELDHLPTLLTIDLVRVEQAPADLRARIEREGEVLFEREEDSPGA